MDTASPMASEEPTRGEIDRNISLVENPRQRGRKKLKPNEKKQKQPMRGMGVAQLERLRVTGQKAPPVQPTVLLPSHHFFLPAPYPDPAGRNGQLGLNQALFLQSLGYGGLGGSDRGLGSDQVRVGFGGMGVGLRSGSYLGENSKELSSIPNPVRYPADQCGLCHKPQKKRVFNGGSLGYNNGFMREKYADDDPSDLMINGFSFNVGNKQHIHGINVDKGVEVVGIHRKGSSGAFMEYDFFPPGKGGRGSSTNELDLSLFSEASVAVLGGGSVAVLGGGGGGGGSCVTTTTASASTAGFDASSTSIDLSLKLSC
ncbi:hypothetical protein RHSIM_RhsimUnG0172800 [Rhododendron simsii]|uniref:Uncharacterized protein n=1 Tax=Rhododendron simsii TaxID=118357 RepID=A0A834L2B9_RHOSS|nr:hypothetical protein RHSIM_RhsimUnG0172800 [Rhododendron simsii]